MFSCASCNAAPISCRNWSYELEANLAAFWTDCFRLLHFWYLLFMRYWYILSLAVRVFWLYAVIISCFFVNGYKGTATWTLHAMLNSHRQPCLSKSIVCSFKMSCLLIDVQIGILYSAVLLICTVLALYRRFYSLILFVIYKSVSSFCQHVILFRFFSLYLLPCSVTLPISMNFFCHFVKMFMILFRKVLHLWLYSTVLADIRVHNYVSLLHPSLSLFSRFSNIHIILFHYFFLHLQRCSFILPISMLLSGYFALQLRFGSVSLTYVHGIINWNRLYKWCRMKTRIVSPYVD
jgi:hypothetical protein